MDTKAEVKRWNARNRFTIRVAGAITGNDPWKQGYSLYHGTYRALMRQLPRITREHGGNIVIEWRHSGQILDHEPIII